MFSSNLQKIISNLKNNTAVYKLKIAQKVFSFTEADTQNTIMLAPDLYNVMNDNKAVTAKIVDYDPQKKEVTVMVKGEFFTVTINDEMDQMLEKLGFANVAAKVIKEIKAPMPGLVLDINVKAGDAVAEGDKLLTLEAMKMENSINIQGAAKIKRIAVKTGQAVEKGQLLIELE